MQRNNRNRVNLGNEPDKTESQQSQDQVELGRNEAVKETVKEEDKSKNKFESLVEGSEKELFRFKTVFPFDILPDEIVIDFNKISIIKKISPLGQKVHGVFIKDVMDVLVKTSIFLSELEIVDAGFVENSIRIKSVRKEDAAKARRIIMGLVVARKLDIDMAAITEVQDVVSKLEKLGESKRSS